MYNKFRTIVQYIGYDDRYTGRCIIKLQELLTSLKISEEGIKAINAAVDTVIASKLIIKDNEIKVLQGDLEKIKGELTPFKEKERQDKIKSILKDITDEDKLGDVITLSGISDKDSEDEIKAKALKVIETRSYLAKTPVNDADAKKEITKTNGNENTPEPKKVKEYRFIDPSIE